MIQNPLTPAEFLTQFKAGKFGNEQLTITDQNVIGGPFILYFSKTEEYWNKPYPKPRSQPYHVKSVTLQGTIISVKGDEFSAKIFGNNGFDKDGETFVFNKNTLLCEQNYTDTERLGIWKMEQEPANA